MHIIIGTILDNLMVFWAFRIHHVHFAQRMSYLLYNILKKCHVPDSLMNLSFDGLHYLRVFLKDIKVLEIIQGIGSISLCLASLESL